MRRRTVRVRDLLKYAREEEACVASIEWLEELDPEMSAYRAWQCCPFWFWLDWLTERTTNALFGADVRVDSEVLHLRESLALGSPSMKQLIEMVEELGGAVVSASGDTINMFSGDSENITLAELRKKSPPRVWATAFRALVSWRDVRDALLWWMAKKDKP